MGIAPSALVAGSPRIPLPYGLFSVFTARQPGPRERWELGGVQWEQFTTDLTKTFEVDGCDGPPLEIDPVESAMGQAEPFYVYGHYRCTPVGNTLDHAFSEASAHLELREEGQAEVTLWGKIMDSGPIDLGEHTLADGVADLEQLFAAVYGSQGVIHLSRDNAMMLAKQGRLEKRGGRLYTFLDTPVIAGSGYSNEEVVITPPIFGYRSEIIPGDVGPIFDKDSNDLYGVAMRGYLLAFDEGSSVKFTVDHTKGGGGVGQPGKSAYEIAVDEGFEGDVTEWLASLKGEQGDPGTAATVKVGTVTKGAPSSQATVTNSGTESAAVLDFNIPQGEQGNPGDPGDDGVVQSIQAGEGIVVDDTDPANPIVGTA